MTDREIDEILKQAAQASPSLDPEVRDRVANSIGSSLLPVRPLPPAWVLTGGLIFVCASVALAGAARSGLYGIEKLSVLECALIFSTLGILIWLAATECVREFIPGSRRRLAPGFLPLLISMALLAVFTALFHDYRSDHFVSQGIVCLIVGLLHAVPTAVVGWLLLRRGCAVNRASAGLAVGTLAALAGVTMLELHCPNLQALHVIVWHTAVIPVSGAVGAWLGSKAR